MMKQKPGVLLAAGTNEVEIIEFYVDEVIEGNSVYRGSYGINVAKVVEIIPQPKVTSLPRAIPGVIGTFISRGKVIPLVDLAVRLGKRKPDTTLNPIAITTEFNKVTMAFLVTGVNRIHRLAWEQIAPPGDFIASFNASITGVVNLEDRNILIVDMEKILCELNPHLSMREDERDVDVVTDIRYKILIVDDSSSVRNILVNRLEKAGFSVKKASDGNEGWMWLQDQKAQSQKEGRSINDYVDIVISDIEMPQMDGYSLCQSIKTDPVLKELPVILFSSLINERQLHKGRSVGADDQISKPETSDLPQRAHELIKKARSRKSS